MNILYIYKASQTYTNTVFEHLASLSDFSRHQSFFVNVDECSSIFVDTSRFDAICVHYTIRLPYDELPASAAEALEDFRGLKFLFIQDEYDNTYRAWHWIKRLGFQLVFTVVPEPAITKVYPPEEFPDTRFVTNLTGYVPSSLNSGSTGVLPPSQRHIVVGYRGRALPVQYGSLGMEKSSVGKMVREYCKAHGVVSDIEWTEGARFYGSAWTNFMLSCRSMLGTESGSNVFDWNGDLQSKIDAFKANNPRASDTDVYQAVVKPIETDGVMNQVSPRVFEAIAARAVLVLFEGGYSGIIRPNEHFIPLRKDGSNLNDVFARLNDNVYVDQMVERAYTDIIGSGHFSYPAFVGMVDRELDRSADKVASSATSSACARAKYELNAVAPISITVRPIRAVVAAPRPMPHMRWGNGEWEIRFPLRQMWDRFTEPVRMLFGPAASRIKRAIAHRGQ